MFVKQHSRSRLHVHLDFTPILDASVQASVGVDSKFMKDCSLIPTYNL
jgi:hypothetical protein